MNIESENVYKIQKDQLLSNAEKPQYNKDVDTTDTSFDFSQKYNFISHHTSDLIAFLSVDVSPVITCVNAAYSKVLGYVSEDLLGKTLFEYIHPEDLKQLKAMLMKCIDVTINGIKDAGLSENVYQLDLRFKDKTGSWHLLKSTMTPLNDDLILISRDVTDQQKFDETISKSEELLLKTFQLSPQMITITSLKDGRYLEINQSFLNHIEFTHDEVIGRTSMELNLWVNPYDRETFQKCLREHGIVRNLEFSMKSKTGKIGNVSMSSEIIMFHGEPCALTISTNITDMNRSAIIIKENEERMKTVIQGLPIAAFVLDTKHQVLYWNQMLEELVHIRAEEMIGTTNHWMGFYPKKRPCLADILIDGGISERKIEKWYSGRYKKLKLDEESYEVIDFFPNLGTDGRWLQFTASAIRDSKGDLIAALETIKDVSEQRKIQIALSESEKKYRLIFNNASDGIVLLDMAGKIVDINEMAAQIVGGNKEEIIGKNFKDLKILSLKDIPKLLKNFTMLIAGKSTALSIKIKNQKGEEKYLETSASVVIQNEEKIGILALVRDVTERKKIEESLKDNEERFRLIVSSMTDILYEWNVQTGRIEWFGDIDHRLGFEIGEFPRSIEGFMNRIDPQDLENVKSIATNGLSTHTKWQGEYRILNKNGIAQYFFGTGIGIYDDEGRPLKIVGSVTDVSKRKQAEISLQESRQMLRLIMDTIPVRVFWKDCKSQYLGCNQTFAHDAGFTSEEAIVGKNDFDMGWVEQAELYRSDDQLIIQTGQPKLNYIEPQTTPDGQKIWLRTSKIPLLDRNNKIIGVLGTYEDITKQKQAEDALRRSEEQYRLVTEYASDVIWTMDLNLRFTYFSPSNEKLTGYRLQEALNLSLDKLLTPESVERALQIFAKEMELEKENNKDFSHSVILELDERRADGTVFPIETKMSFLRDKDNNPIGIIGITRDITERKKAEDALKKSERKFVKAFKLSPVAIAINRMSDGRFLDVNEAFTKICGYDSSEIISHTPVELNLWVDTDYVKKILDHLKTSGSVYNMECIFRTKAGTHIITRYSAEIIDFSDEPCYLSVILDVTQQKNMEESLKESEEKYRSIVENTQDVVMLTIPTGRVDYISPACLDVLGTPAEEIVGKIPEIFHQDDVEKVHSALSKALAGEPGTNLEYRVLTKDGSVRWVSHSWAPVLDQGKKLKYVVSVVRNITDTKVFEQDLKIKIEELERYKNITVNREVKMIQLKKENQMLKERLMELEKK